MTLAIEFENFVSFNNSQTLDPQFRKTFPIGTIRKRITFSKMDILRGGLKTGKSFCSESKAPQPNVHTKAASPSRDAAHAAATPAAR